MQILADENIVYVNSAFATLGEVRTFSARDLRQVDLGNAEVLLVRSITPVNATLLANSQIRFVGTASIGYDHIDVDSLRHNKIGFSSAPGCNATSAAEYVISALLIIAQQQGFKLRDKTVGIIGCGNVGSRVLHKLKALGVHCLVYDPPLYEKTACNRLVDLKTVLSADIITLHVPLQKEGYYPTYHLVDEELLAQLREDVILVNASRGDVVNETSLLRTLAARPKMTVVVDVWKGEPQINLALLQRATLATPHIAGHSFDGKARATEMLYNAVCYHFHYAGSWQLQQCLPPAPVTHLTFSSACEDDSAIQTAVMTSYDVRSDDMAFRLMQEAENLPLFFDKLRKYYPIRREFSCITIKVPEANKQLAEQLRGLGFSVESDF